MSRLLARLRLVSLRSLMLLVFVGGLCLAQALYLFLGHMQIHSGFREHMIVRAIDKFVLQAEVLAEDHDVTLPATTASRLTSLDRAWLAPMSALDVSPLSRDPALEARLHEALAERGVAVVAVEAGYGVRPRSNAETTARQQSFGEWALPSQTQIAARLPFVPQWLNVTIGSHPPPPITPRCAVSGPCRRLRRGWHRRGFDGHPEHERLPACRAGGDARGHVCRGRDGARHRAGNDSNDSLLGSSNDDIFCGGADKDVLKGEDGTGTTDYGPNSGRVVIDMTAGMSAAQHDADGTDETGSVVSTDTLSDIETLSRTSDDDGQGGSAEDNALWGQGGDDTLKGYAGSETLYGGDGIDRVMYEDNPGPVSVDLADNMAEEGAANGTVVSTDTLRNIENVLGTIHNYNLYGDENDNILMGGAGSDRLTGGGGTDTARHANTAGKVSVSLSARTAHAYGADGGSGSDTVVSTDTFVGISVVIGTAHDDDVEGSVAGGDTLSGGSGTNSLNGGANDDVFVLDLDANQTLQDSS